MAARLEAETETDPKLAAALDGTAGAAEREAPEGGATVVPVPLHWRRRLRRGYNQAEEIARPLAARLGFRFSRSLRRRRATPRQTSLSREHRRSNPAGAFVCRRTIAGTVILVDDVTTTGATLGAAAVCLKQAGARRVVALVAARTPGSNEPSGRRAAPHPRPESPQGHRPRLGRKS